jgi:hypothetical protein
MAATQSMPVGKALRAAAVRRWTSMWMTLVTSESSSACSSVFRHAPLEKFHT